MKKEFVFCPNCGYELSQLNYTKSIDQELFFSSFSCSNCNYTGMPLKSENKKEFKKIKFKPK